MARRLRRLALAASFVVALAAPSTGQVRKEGRGCACTYGIRGIHRVTTGILGIHFGGSDKVGGRWWVNMTPRIDDVGRWLALGTSRVDWPVHPVLSGGNVDCWILTVPQAFVTSGNPHAFDTPNDPGLVGCELVVQGFVRIEPPGSPLNWLTNVCSTRAVVIRFR